MMTSFSAMVTDCRGPASRIQTDDKGDLPRRGNPEATRGQGEKAGSRAAGGDRRSGASPYHWFPTSGAAVRCGVGTYSPRSHLAPAAFPPASATHAAIG